MTASGRCVTKKYPQQYIALYGQQALWKPAAIICCGRLQILVWEKYSADKYVFLARNRSTVHHFYYIFKYRRHKTLWQWDIIKSYGEIKCLLHITWSHWNKNKCLQFVVTCKTSSWLSCLISIMVRIMSNRTQQTMLQNIMWISWAAMFEATLYKDDHGRNLVCFKIQYDTNFMARISKCDTLPAASHKFRTVLCLTLQFLTTIIATDGLSGR
jgi:hypothetical protein